MKTALLGLAFRLVLVISILWPFLGVLGDFISLDDDFLTRGRDRRLWGNSRQFILTRIEITWDIAFGIDM